MENNVMKPFRIAITETYVKEVEIYAPDEYTAMQHAEDLCAEGIIDFDYDNFVDRDTECRGLSRPADLQLHEVYEAEEGAIARPVLENTVYPAFLAGDAVYIDGIKITMNHDEQLFCRLDNERFDRPLRDDIGDIKEGDAFFWGERGLIRVAYDDAKLDPYICEDVAIVIGTDDEVYYVDDIGKDIGRKIREVLTQAKEAKPSLADQMSAAENRAQNDNNNPTLPCKEPER